MARSLLSLIHDQALQICDLTARSQIASANVSAEQLQLFRNMLDELTRVKQTLQTELGKIDAERVRGDGGYDG